MKKQQSEALEIARTHHHDRTIEWGGCAGRHPPCLDHPATPTLAKIWRAEGLTEKGLMSSDPPGEALPLPGRGFVVVASSHQTLEKPTNPNAKHIKDHKSRIM